MFPQSTRTLFGFVSNILRSTAGWMCTFKLRPTGECRLVGLHFTMIFCARRCWFFSYLSFRVSAPFSPEPPQGWLLRPDKDNMQMLHRAGINKAALLKCCPKATQPFTSGQGTGQADPGTLMPPAVPSALTWDL